MNGEDLIRFIQSKPSLLIGDVRYTIRALIEGKRINPSVLIDESYAVKDEESRRYRLHWQEANVAANILMTGDEKQQEFGRMRLMYNSLSDTTIPYKGIYANKISTEEKEECRRFFEMMYGFNAEE